MFKHLKDNNVSYVKHFCFAFKVGASLVIRGYIFIMHAFFPFGNIPGKWNLEQTSLDLYNWNKEAEKR